MDHFSAISLKQLRALAAIIRCGSLTAAADQLSVTPPAVSTQLRTLEANVCARVMNRGPDGKVGLTAAGAELLAAAQSIEKILALCEQRMAALASGHTGHVAVGVVSTAKYFAPKLLTLTRKALPDIAISLRIGNREATIAALLGGETDIAIMGRPPRDPDALSEPLGPNPHILIAAPDHPLAGAGEIGPADLREQTFLLREQGSGTRILTERYLDEMLQGALYDSLELGTNETIKQGVMAGLGVAMLSAHTVVGELDTGRMVVLRAPGLPIVRQWYVVRLGSRPVSPAALTLAQFLVDNRAEVLPDVTDLIVPH